MLKRGKQEPMEGVKKLICNGNGNLKEIMDVTEKIRFY